MSDLVALANQRVLRRVLPLHMLVVKNFSGLHRRATIFSMPAPQASKFAQLARKSFQSAASVGMAAATARVAVSAPRGGQRIDYEAFIDNISAAICSAWSVWQSSATLVSVVINGPTAMGGQVVGPPWAPLILARSPSQNPEAAKMTNTIASVLGPAWLTFTATIKVPGLPWYPAFAALPSPVAPPTHNIPCPVAALTMVTASIGSNVLTNQMAGMDGSGSSDHKRLYAAIASAFETTFNLWKVSTIVTHVLGTGPVPTFAPPCVPIGPVVAGVGTMTPGGFS
jgi:hypothetical protein